jgi:tetratricopeptide (TPR) repeat protein
LTRVEQGRAAAAQSEYEAAIQRAPYYPFLYYNLGLLFERTGRARQAERTYGRALELFDSRAAEFDRRAESWRDAGNAEEERIARIRARELRRNRAQVLNALGTLLEARGEIEDAETHYRNAMQADPSLLAAAHNLALLLRANSRLDEAISLWEKIVSADASLSVAAVRLAEAYQAQGATARAKAQYQRVLMREPDHFEARRGLAETLAFEKDLAGAIAELSRAIRDQVNHRAAGSRGGEFLASAEYYERLGDLHLAQQARESACTQFRLAARAAKSAPYSGNRRQLKRKASEACVSPRSGR